ncbi:MAG: hypothetical protein R2797_07890 [Gelidibacter sp.]
MDEGYYLETFKKSADQLDKSRLKEKQLELYVGITLNSVVLKLYKTKWANPNTDPINAKTRIFFAIWVNHQTLKQNKVYYNIHALKLREMKGYTITSRAFADSFRKELVKYTNDWDNVKMDLGPLTLMEGWVQVKDENLETCIVQLANKFINIDDIIDNTLKKFKQTK